MPAIYKGACLACGAESPITQDGYLACRTHGSEVTPLPHPAEIVALEKLGYTYAEARKEQRLVWVSNLVCDTCGDVAERHEVKPNESCLILIVMTVFGFLFCFAFLPPAWAFVAGMLWFYLFSFLYSAIERYLVRDAQRMLREPPICPKCVDGKYRRFAKISGKKSVCRVCGEREVKYEVLGFS